MGKLSDGRAFPLSAETAPASLHVQSWVPRGAADSQRGRFVRGDPFLPEPHLCAVCRGIHVHGKTPHPQDFTEKGQEIKRQMYVFLLLKKRFNDSKMYRHENNRLPLCPSLPLPNTSARGLLFGLGVLQHCSPEDRVGRLPLPVLYRETR